MRFKNSRSRLERAARHIHNLIEECATLLHQEGFAAEARHDVASGWFIATAALSPAMTERIANNTISLEIGELAYQLRAALDGLIWEAVAITQGSEPPADANNLEFPILNGKKRNFNECGFHRYPFPDQLRTWLASIQPDASEKPPGDPERGLKAALEDIHDLARKDRHRRLRIATVTPKKIEFSVETYPFPATVVAREMIETCDLFGGHYDFLRFKLKPTEGVTPYRVILKTKILFEVTVEDIEPYEGEDIGRQLMRFIRAVEIVIEKFESLV